ncbi:Transcription factor TFIIIB component B [Aspergillus hancockii]|nr:Transcription factor TFIIIB component B [Aspergillus hancockii]
MKSFSSSAINKSGKKFAPKAPARRAAPAPAAPARRPSAASQVSASQTPQPQTQTATPESAPPVSTAEPSSTPQETPAPDSTALQEKSASPAPATQNASATAVPIPRPKRKASFSAFTLSQPPTTTATESTPLPSIEVAPDVAPDEQRVDRVPVEELAPSESRVDKEPSPVAKVPTEIRPSKRVKKSTQPAVSALEPQPPTEVSHLVTPPATQTSTNEEITEEQDTTESQHPTDQKPKPTKSKRRKSSKDVNGENKPNRTRERKPRTRKQREPTPEGSELVQIAPGIVRMSELCKDLRTGKISKRETELRQMELAEIESKQKAQQDEEKGEKPEQMIIKDNDDAGTPALETGDSGDPALQSGPVMRIVNGEIVLDATSLEVDRHAESARNAGELEDVVENSLTRRVNQASYGKRSKTESWDEEMTDLFYRGLRMFGTDFMMISKLFPGRSRRQIKLKFNNEERRDPARIKDTLLGPREAVDITTYSEMTNTVYDDPKVIQQELDEEKKRIEDQHAKEKQAQEDLLKNPDGAADGRGPAAPDTGNNAPVKSRRSNKKQAAKDLGGTEEILGTIDEFP